MTVKMFRKAVVAVAREHRVSLDLTRKMEDEVPRKYSYRTWAYTEVAEQIIKMRKKRNMTQATLAMETKTKQSAISRIEQATYAGGSFHTLVRVAHALKARLRIELEPIEQDLKRFKEHS